MFNSYFILLSGDFGSGFSQGLATLYSPITVTWSLILLLPRLGSRTSLREWSRRLHPRPRAPPSWAGSLSFLCLFHEESGFINQQRQQKQKTAATAATSSADGLLRGQSASGLESKAQVNLIEF